MSNRIQLFPLFVSLLALSLSVFSQTPSRALLIETSKGNIKCVLFEETPMHTENFVDLAVQGFYDGLLFHRVIQDFMVQTGDPRSRNASRGDALGYGDPGYTIPAEFHPGLYHWKGVLASARQPDRVNPRRESNGSQFYIVQGEKFSDAELDAMEKSGSHIAFTPEQRTRYREIGGAPHLDYAYTVFGEVVEGLDVVDRIASVPTDERSRPLEDVKIIRISILNENL